MPHHHSELWDAIYDNDAAIVRSLKTLRDESRCDDTGLTAEVEDLRAQIHELQDQLASFRLVHD